MESSSRQKISFMGFKSISNTMIRIVMGSVFVAQLNILVFLWGSMFLAVIKVSLTPRKRRWL